MAQGEWRGSPSGGAVGSGRPGPWNILWDARVLGFLSSRGPDGAVPPTHWEKAVNPGQDPDHIFAHFFVDRLAWWAGEKLRAD